MLKGIVELPTEVQPRVETTPSLLLAPLPTLPTSPSSDDWYGISYLERFKIDVPDLRDLPKVPEFEPIRTEGQLVKHLLSGYQRRGRPVINASEAVVVSFGGTLQQILSFDEEAGTITTNIWLNFEWMDPRLAWNESHANGIEDVRLNRKDVWLPDIDIYNLVKKNHLGREGNDELVLTSSGSITWIPPFLLTTTCKVDNTGFPFDEQNCKIKFRSWSHTAKMIEIHLKDEQLDLASYVLNDDWALNYALTELSEISHGAGSTYQSLTFTINLKRRTWPGFMEKTLSRHIWILIRSSLLTIINILSFLMAANQPSPRLLLHLVSLLTLSLDANKVPQPSLMATLLGSCTFTIVLAIVHTVLMASLANCHGCLLVCNPICPTGWVLKKEEEIIFKEKILTVVWWIDFAAFCTYLVGFSIYFLATTFSS